MEVSSAVMEGWRAVVTVEGWKVGWEIGLLEVMDG